MLFCFICLVLAMFAKPSVATAGLAAIALDRWIVGRPWRAVLAPAAPLLAVAVPFVLIGIATQGVRDEAETR